MALNEIHDWCLLENEFHQWLREPVDQFQLATVSGLKGDVNRKYNVNGFVMIRIHNDHPLWWPAKVSAHSDPYEFIQIQSIMTHLPSMKLPLALQGHMHVQSLIDDYNRISDEFSDKVNLKFVLPFSVFGDQLRLKISKYIWVHLSRHPLHLKSPLPLHKLISKGISCKYR